MSIGEGLTWAATPKGASNYAFGAFDYLAGIARVNLAAKKVDKMVYYTEPDYVSNPVFYGDYVIYANWKYGQSGITFYKTDYRTLDVIDYLTVNVSDEITFMTAYGKYVYAFRKYGECYKINISPLNIVSTLSVPQSVYTGVGYKNYLYFVPCTSSIKLYRIDLNTFTLDTTYIERTDAEQCYEMTKAGDYAYILCYMYPSKIVVMNLRNFQYVTTVTLPSGRDIGITIDTDEKYLYVGYEVWPGSISKIKIDTLEEEKYVSLTELDWDRFDWDNVWECDAQIESLRVIGKNVLAIEWAACPTGKFVLLDNDLNKIKNIHVSLPEIGPEDICILNNKLYVAFEGDIDFYRIGAIIGFDLNLNKLIRRDFPFLYYTFRLTPYNNYIYAYVCSRRAPSYWDNFIYKLDPDTLTTLGKLTISLDSGAINDTILEGNILYLVSAYITPFIIYKVDLNTLQIIGSSPTGLTQYPQAMTILGDYIYVGCSTTYGRILEVNKDTLEQTRTKTLGPGENHIWDICNHGGYLYATCSGSPDGPIYSQVLKVDPSTLDVVDKIFLDNVEDGESLLVVGNYLYVGRLRGEITKIDLNTFTKVDTIKPFTVPVSNMCAVGNYLYALGKGRYGNAYDYAGIAKINLNTFSVEKVYQCQPDVAWGIYVGKYLGKLIEYTVEILSAIGGTTNPAPGKYNYSENVEIIIEAIPDEGFKFDHWIINGTVYYDNPVTITVVGNTIVQPVFAEKVKYNVTINTTEGGTTSPEPGTYQYHEDTEVNIQALPDSGYVFDYWEIDGEISYNNPITITVTKNMSITAYFRAGGIFGVVGETILPGEAYGEIISEGDYIYSTYTIFDSTNRIYLAKINKSTMEVEESVLLYEGTDYYCASTVASDGTYVYSALCTDYYSMGFYVYKVRISDMQVVDTLYVPYNYQSGRWYPYSSIIVGNKLYIGMDTTSSSIDAIVEIDLTTFTVSRKMTVLSEFPRIFDMIYYNGYLYAVDYYNYFYKIDLDTLSIVDYFDSDDYYWGGTRAARIGNKLYTPDYYYSMFVINLDNLEHNVYSIPGTYPRSIATDGVYLYVGTDYGGPEYFYKIDKDTIEVVDTIEYPAYTVWDMCVSSGYLYALIGYDANGYGRVVKIAL